VSGARSGLVDGIRLGFILGVQRGTQIFNRENAKGWISDLKFEISKGEEVEQGGLKRTGEVRKTEGIQREGTEGRPEKWAHFLDRLAGVFVPPAEPGMKLLIYLFSVQ
jgi:hypothetical protein